MSIIFRTRWSRFPWRHGNVVPLVTTRSHQAYLQLAEQNFGENLQQNIPHGPRRNAGAFRAGGHW